MFVYKSCLISLDYHLVNTELLQRCFLAFYSACNCVLKMFFNFHADCRCWFCWYIASMSCRRRIEGASVGFKVPKPELSSLAVQGVWYKPERIGDRGAVVPECERGLDQPPPWVYSPSVRRETVLSKWIFIKQLGHILILMSYMLKVKKKWSVQ